MYDIVEATITEFIIVIVNVVYVAVAVNSRNQGFRGITNH